MRNLALSISALAVALCLAGNAALAHEDGHDDDGEITAWRLFVSDHAEPVVKVIDAPDGDLLDTFTLQGPATLHRSASGETVFAVQGGAGIVSVIATGIAFHDHGDHADIDVDEPALLEFALEGERPAHFVEYQGHVAQWFDGEAEARLFTERAVLHGHAEIRAINIGAAHHGVAVPYHDHAVVSIPNPQDASQRPVGARVIDLDGNRIGEDVACPGLHGSAGSGSLHALACGTGLLLISQQGGVPRIDHLAYPPSLPEGSSSTLIGGRGLQYFIGNYGPDRILVVDPAEGEDGFQLVQFPTRRVHFAVDPIRPRFAYVFTEDGRLHKVDVLHGEIEHSVALTDPYSMDGPSSDPRPRVAVAGDNVVVTDPIAGRLHLVDAASFEKAAEIEVGGRPFNVVAVGGSGAAHDDHEDDGHEGHGHDHSHGNSDGHDHARSGDGHDHDDHDDDHDHD